MSHMDLCGHMWFLAVQLVGFQVATMWVEILNLSLQFPVEKKVVKVKVIK